MAMSRSVLSTDGPCRFSRSQSRVFYESDISRSTSWEFCMSNDLVEEIPCPDDSVHLSKTYTKLNATSSPINLSQNYNSCSSEESHRSQDSGFLDSKIFNVNRSETKNPELILASSPLSPIFPEINGYLTSFSSPTCSSTPKRVPLVPINNFETLNKNSRRAEENNNRTYALSSPENKSESRTLPRGFKRAKGSELIFRSHFDNSSMRSWLFGVRGQAESEILNCLQVKSIEEEQRKTTNKLENGQLSAPLISIRITKQALTLISQLYSGISRKMESLSLANLLPLIEELLFKINKFLDLLREYNGRLSEGEVFLGQSSQDLLIFIKNIQRAQRESLTPEIDLSKAFEHIHLSLETPPLPKPHSKTESHEPKIIKEDVVGGLMRIGTLFSQTVDTRLSRDFFIISNLISSGGLFSRVALESLLNLLLDGGTHIYRVASSTRIVNVLLFVSSSFHSETERILALRSLATLLCVSSALKDFDRANGFEIVTEIVSDPESSLKLKFEGVAVLTQATDPWIDLETSLSSLATNLEKIVSVLTFLIPYCDTEDEFLLTIAALSNLTFLELSSIELLRYNRTISHIMNKVETGPEFSVFIKDHVSTICANMAGVENCRSDIIHHNGIQQLIKFLHTSPLNLMTRAEVTAAERVQQKSTIALSRLCSEDGAAYLIYKLNGIQRLVNLCKSDRERNYSDGVLIASLATLRKLVSICGGEVIKELEAEELIEPRLLDSFLMFSSRQESYV